MGRMKSHEWYWMEVLIKINFPGVDPPFLITGKNQMISENV